MSLAVIEQHLWDIGALIAVARCAKRLNIPALRDCVDEQVSWSEKYDQDIALSMLETALERIA